MKRKRSLLMDFDLAGKSADAPGMICGGQARILLDYILVSPGNREFFKQWLNILTSGQNHYFLTGIQTEKDTIQVIGHAIISSNQIYGNILKPAEKEYIRSEIRGLTSTSILDIGDIQVIVDPIRKIKTVYCFGAGHVAVPTAKIAAMTGFRVVVIDDRADFASMERFPEAYELRVIEDFEKAFEGLSIDTDSYIIILTRGHKFDRIVLEGSLKTGAGYIGMISSRIKREAIYKALLEKGIRQEQLEKVHSPIGLSIGGETPEEIAVSIVAELINERWKQQGSR